MYWCVSGTAHSRCHNRCTVMFADTVQRDVLVCLRHCTQHISQQMYCNISKDSAARAVLVSQLKRFHALTTQETVHAGSSQLFEASSMGSIVVRLHSCAVQGGTSCRKTTSCCCYNVSVAMHFSLLAVLKAAGHNSTAVSFMLLSTSAQTVCE
jgi:hypothetical protein